MKRICVLHGLHLEKLTFFTLGDDFYRVILGCQSVESVPEYFSNDGAS
jgi:hypothetical protein